MEEYRNFVLFCLFVCFLRSIDEFVKELTLLLLQIMEVDDTTTNTIFHKKTTIPRARTKQGGSLATRSILVIIR